MKRVFISGPMRSVGFEESKKRFIKAERYLKEKNYEVVNPWNFGLNSKIPWGDAMLVDLSMLKTCECVYMLNGWENAHGAVAEYHFAVGTNKEILFENETIK